jgi:hypothetical protein
MLCFDLTCLLLPLLACGCNCIIQIDGDDMDSSGIKLQQSQEDEGAITTMLLPLEHLYGELQRLEKDGCGIFVGLYSIAQGLRMAAALGGLTKGASFSGGLFLHP